MNTLITGASAGLGEGMARQFAAKGRNLALCARRTDRLDELAGELRERHPGISVLTRELDVNDHDRVFTVFDEFREQMGTLDRVVLNAGLGKGQPLGTGYFAANRQTAQTNFVATLAQAEAAMRIFRRQRAGHLVLMSSFTAVRGMPGNLTTYAASKAAVLSLAQGIRADVTTTPITVTTLLPGYIESEMTSRTGTPPLLTGAEKGARALVGAIEREKASAYIPALPWAPLSLLVRCAPRGLLRRFV